MLSYGGVFFKSYGKIDGLARVMFRRGLAG